MKKYTAIILVAAFFITACNTNSEKTAEELRMEQEKKDSGDVRKISKRNSFIDKNNSYSDLFLDSMAMEKFIAEKKLPDSMSRRMRSFYNTRNYQFAWFSSDGLTEQARGFWNLHDYVVSFDPDSSLKDAALQKKMDALIEKEELSISGGSDYVTTELNLTNQFIQYMLKNYEKGYVKRKEIERFVPYQKANALSLADSLINKKHKDDKYYEDVNPTYGALKEQLKKYYAIAEKGGWQPISTKAKTLKKGTQAPEIVLVKKRLQATGELAVMDTSQVFNDTLETAVKNFQLSHGFTDDGIITAALIKEMNVPAVDRLKQILVNMDRMRWLANEPKGNLIVVNIPEFELHVYEGNKKVFDMDVVVGKDGHNTMMFNGEMNQVVFSPYWNIPPSITRDEIVPAMNRNSSYLARQNMEVVGNNDGLPVVRQKPGPGNALGRVKFLFPNSFSIYMHDTPAKSLFVRDKRAFSHGCIRLREPEKMANYVLRNQKEWTPEKIEEAMNAGTEKFVKIKDPITVLITYYTAWVDDAGRMNFREDIYGHDASLARKMFQ
jgi:murein L,D-transpeptidase YcbB/YkuD